jgi:transcriptional regulator NrdR family protein
MTENNPLSRYFRQPTIYMRLPSSGRHYPAGTIDLPANGELPVYPMTVRDEIINKTPDALFNGSAVVNLIQSCVPNIKDAWAIPSVDLDSILIAIKVATYGKDLDITGSCTHCRESSDYVIDLNRVLADIGITDYNCPQRIGQFELMFRPLSYHEINETSKEQFNEQKILNILPESGLSDQERVQQINQLIVKITDGTISALSKSISSIRTDDVIVTDEQQIHEFLNNCPNAMFTAIRDAAVAKRQAGAMKPLKLTCNHCEKQYEQTLTLDLSNFFAPSS